MIAQLPLPDVQCGQLGDLRDRAAAVGQLPEHRVEGLQVEQSELCGGISAHGWALPRGTSRDR